MTTTPDQRQILRDWRDTHNDIQPDHEGHVCSRLIWVEGRCAGQCGETSQWISRGRYLCEPHTVERIELWVEAEREEVPA